MVVVMVVVVVVVVYAKNYVLVLSANFWPSTII